MIERNKKVALRWLIEFWSERKYEISGKEGTNL